MKIRNPFSKSERAPEAPKPPSQLTPKDVWEAPANYNRATRRWARLWGRIWSWDQQALGLPADLPRRYARRHFDSTKFLYPKTRRQRKERARIMRVARTPKPSKLLTLAVERRANRERQALANRFADTMMGVQR